MDLEAHFRNLLKVEVAHTRELQRAFDAMNPDHKLQSSDPDGAVQGIRIALREQHSRRISHGTAVIETLEKQVIPELRFIREAVSQKVNDIRDLSTDFSNELGTLIDGSKRALKSLQQAIEDWEKRGHVPATRDPFLVDLASRKQIRLALAEENYLQETTANLEESGKLLERAVTGSLRRAIAIYTDTIASQAAESTTTARTVNTALELDVFDREWNSFVESGVSSRLLVDPATPLRRLENIPYSGRSHTATNSICDGFLEKKSKYLKHYTSSFYILTPASYLHEFKSNDLRLDIQPTFTLYLPDCELGEMSREHDSSQKFIVRGTQSGGIHTSHNWIFRARNREDMIKWYNRIEPFSKRREQPSATQNGSGSLRSRDSLDLASGTGTRPVLTESGVSGETELTNDEADGIPFAQPEPHSGPVKDVFKRSAAGKFHTGELATNARSPSSGQDGIIAEKRSDTAESGSIQQTQRNISVFQTDSHDRDKVAMVHNDTSSLSPSKPGAGPVPLAIPEVAMLRKIEPSSPLETSAGRTPVPAPGPGAVPVASPIISVPSSNIRQEAAGISQKESKRDTQMQIDKVVPENLNRDIKKETLQKDGYAFAPALPSPGLGILPVFSDRSPYFPISHSPQSPKSPTDRKQPFADLEPPKVLTYGDAKDSTSPYPIHQRFSLPPSRRVSLDVTPNSGSDLIPATGQVGEIVIPGTNADPATRFKVGSGNSRRGSRSVSAIATPSEHAAGAAGFTHGALEGVSESLFERKLGQVESRGPPSRNHSFDVQHGYTATGNDASAAHTGQSSNSHHPNTGNHETDTLRTIEKDLRLANLNNVDIGKTMEIPGTYPSTSHV